MAPKYASGQSVRYKPVGGEWPLIFSFLGQHKSLLIPHNDGTLNNAGGLINAFASSTGPDSNTSESTGVIRNVLTEPGMQASRHVQASVDEPRYEVRDASNNGGGL
ncbi:hypothetical protein F5Y14DRAFT_408538 [Nemania sp. NC0429]|nr:hypothetical protein F5Y14DRAFT_408538 [Nemania sp. NC0429]